MWKMLQKVKLRNHRPPTAGIVKHVLNRGSPPGTQIYFGENILPGQAAQGGKTLHAQIPMIAKLVVLVLELFSQVSSKGDQGICLSSIGPKLDTSFGFEPSLSHSAQWQLAFGPICAVVHSQPGLRQAWG